MINMILRAKTLVIVVTVTIPVTSKQIMVKDLSVPRDRNGDFDTALFQPYQR